MDHKLPDYDTIHLNCATQDIIINPDRRFVVKYRCHRKWRIHTTTRSSAIAEAAAREVRYQYAAEARIYDILLCGGAKK